MNLVKNQKGQGLTEYLILILLVSVVSIGAVKVLGGTINRKIQMAAGHINKGVQLNENKGGQRGSNQAGTENSFSRQAGNAAGEATGNFLGGVLDGVKGALGYGDE